MTQWRVGRKLGRTIYLQKGDQPSDHDKFLGIMDDPAIAKVVVSAVNYYIEQGGLPR